MFPEKVIDDTVNWYNHVLGHSGITITIETIQMLFKEVLPTSLALGKSCYTIALKFIKSSPLLIQQQLCQNIMH